MLSLHHLRTRFGTIGLGLLTLASVHCSGSPDDAGAADAPPLDAPPSASLDSADVSCKSDQNCATGESCNGGVCQLPRCSEPPNPATPPLGNVYRLAPVQQLLAVGGGSSVNGFEGAALTALAGGSLSAAGAPSAIAGGSFLGTHEDALATVAAGSMEINVVSKSGGSAPVTLGLSFSPTAIAGGDMDGDGVDDVVALGSGGQIGICHVSTKACDETTMATSTGIDLAVGNVIANTPAAAVLLTKSNNSTALTVWNAQPSTTPIQLTLPNALSHVAVGDLDGDGTLEIAGLENGGKLHIYHVVGDSLAEAGAVNVASDAINLAMGSLDGSPNAQIALLRSRGVVDILAGKTAASITRVSSSTLAGMQGATRIAFADVLGKSAVGTLTGPPVLVEGRAVPVVAMFFPPYSQKHSNGPSSATISTSASTTTSEGSGMSLSASFQLGLSVDIPAIVKVGVSAKVGASLSTKTEKTQTVRLSELYTLNPAAGAKSGGGVLLAGSCYRAYSYKISDPSGKLGTDGTTMAIYAPVGGQKAVWSLSRYNGLARALGGMPILPETYSASDPSTYPSTPATFGGHPIPGSDLVFTQLSSYRASDVSSLTWTLDMSQGQTNSNASTATASASISASATFGIGMSMSADVGGSISHDYSINLGTSTSFSGVVPQLQDASYGYSFTPIVYREHYRDSIGADGSFYVVTYTVGK